MTKIKTNTTTWDLSPLFSGLDDKGIKKNKKQTKKRAEEFIKNWNKDKSWLKDPKKLKKALDEYEELMANFGTGGDFHYYFNLNQSLDQNNPKIKSRLNKATEFAKETQVGLQFFELQLAKVDQKTQSKFLKSKVLADYKHFLEQLFATSKYLLSEPEEKIMNLKSTSSYSNWVKMTQSLYSKEEREVLTEEKTKDVKNFSEILGLINSKQKRVRDSAAASFNNILKTHIDVVENEINSVLQDKKVNDSLRGYERPDKARHTSDDIDTEVVDTLTKTVTNKFKVAKDYYKLKAKLFGVDKLEYHERNVEYGRVDKKYEYDEAVELIYKVFSDLDKEFARIFKDFVEGGQVDVFPKKGKQAGAFCVYNLKTQPVYVLLNYTKLLDDVRTFAHEFGHAINDVLMKEQNALSFGTPTSTAEVASTFFEDFVIQELIKDADDEQKLSLMVAKLNSDVSSIFRQIAFYNFEKELHQKFREKGYLGKDAIGKIFQKHMKSYMGPAVEQSEGSQNWWAYVPHFRRYFYVYSYSSGLLISKSLQAQVKRDKKAIKKVKKFLSAGSSDAPKNIFSEMGIDITDKKFWDKGLGEVKSLLKETKKLAKKLDKI